MYKHESERNNVIDETINFWMSIARLSIDFFQWMSCDLTYGRDEPTIKKRFSPVATRLSCDKVKKKIETVRPIIAWE